MIKLIGVLIVVVGISLNFEILSVVLSAGLVTGLVSGMSISDILIKLGDAFVTNRYMSLFVLTLPIIGLAERYGLKERASELIGNIKAVTAGRVIMIYEFFRLLAAAFGLRLGGHPTFVRPLVYPMAEGALKKDRKRNLLDKEKEIIKAHSAAAENYGNFFGQNVFLAAGGILLIQGVLKEAGYNVELLTMAKYAIPTAFFAILYGFIQFYLMDRKLNNINKESSVEEEKANGTYN
ncbi:MAG TPA: DUF969 domain-containing protein [Candidatus Mcinerneyibacterium sp.]|nr:DUF969 domain-containing protein [Candidatus Mcinerneyibacterium sp.]